LTKDNEFIKFLLIGLSAFCIAFLLVSFTPSKIPQGLNDLSVWYTYFLSRKNIESLNLVGIAVDEHSLNKVPGRWPWRRSLYAQLIQVLDREKVDTIGIDFAFVGESDNKEDDLLLSEALNNSSSRVVLAYFFDPAKDVSVFPLRQLKESAYSVGMFNTPVDPDGTIRRLRGYIASGGKYYYSLSVALSAAFLKQEPEEIISRLPLLKDRTFFINYLLRQQDIIRISFYDALKNLKGLKTRYGEDFLKDSLVLVYPEAEILHDTYATPLGKMPGGFLHFNGAASIITGRLIKEINILSIPFIILSFFILFFILRYNGFLVGTLLTIGVLIFDFWGLVLLTLSGIRFDYSFVAIFVLLFFISGSFYKYLYFLAQILKIKSKATLDPLTNLFTLRYFYYRLRVELRKIYFRRDLFLIFIYLESFKDVVEDMPLQTLRGLWREISLLISIKGKFWSAYSHDELVGFMISSPAKVRQAINSLKNNLEALCLKKNIKSNIRIAYLKPRKNYPIREALFTLSDQLRNQDEEVVFFKDEDLVSLLEAPTSKRVRSGRLLDSLDEDIEEKNKQLLSLIEESRKEHSRTKEAFFQIITSLVNALEARDSYTQGHSERVCKYALMMAEKLGWPNEEKEKLRKAALLHDLGKIGIPDSVLHKKGQLNKEELDFIRKHETIGIKILQPMEELKEIFPLILYHHERWDGKGYPEGLAGGAIPVGAQIISLADVFDALTTGRDYKVALSLKDSIKEMKRNRGTQFNPKFLDLFIKLIKTQEVS